jgi:hypothetical protein
MKDPDLSFLQAKIASIGTALFFCENKYILSFPAYIVKALKTDDQGYIWFFISRNWKEKLSYDVPFPADLEFYRKGYPYSIKIGGYASLINDAKLIHQFMQDVSGESISVNEEAISGVLLVKVKIASAVSKELITRKPYNPLHNISFLLKNIWYPAHTQLQPSV